MAITNIPVSRQSFRWLLAEMVVVIIGILIALQVEEWRVQVSERDQEQVLLVNMLDDFAFNKGLLESYRFSLDCSTRMFDQYAGYLESDSVRDEAVMQEVMTGCFQFYWTPSSPTYSGWRDLGRPDLITDNEIRKSLNQFHEGFIPFLQLTSARMQEKRDILDQVMQRDWDMNVQLDAADSDFRVLPAPILPLADAPRHPEFFEELDSYLIAALNLKRLVERAITMTEDIESQIQTHLSDLES